MTEIDAKDDVLGRARVRESAELTEYYKDLAEIDTGALWTVANDIEPWEPTPKSDPIIWRHSDLRKQVLKGN